MLFHGHLQARIVACSLSARSEHQAATNTVSRIEILANTINIWWLTLAKNWETGAKTNPVLLIASSLILALPNIIANNRIESLTWPD